MKHIRNSIKGIYILEHDGNPTVFNTDFNEPIPNGSLCIDKVNADIFILNSTSWNKVAAFDSEGSFIPLTGTESNMPVTGNIEMSQNISLQRGITKVTFNDNFLLFSLNDNDTDTIESLLYKLDQNTLRYRTDTEIEVSDNSNNNYLNHGLGNIQILNNSFSNTIFGHNIGLNLTGSGCNFFNSINQSVSLTNSLYNNITGNFLNLSMSNISNNLLIGSLLGLTNILYNVSDNILNVNSENFTLNNVYRSLISGKYYNSSIITTCYDSFIHIMNSTTTAKTLSRIYGSEIRIDLLKSILINNLYNSKILSNSFNSEIDNIKNSIFIGNCENTIFNNSTYLDILGNNVNTKIEESNNIYLRGNYQNISIEGNDITIIGSHEFDNESKLIGDNIVIIGDANFSTTNVSDVIAIGDVNLTDKISDNNIIISKNTNNDIDSNNYENNIFINCEAVVADGSNSVYFPSNIKLSDNDKIATFDMSETTSSVVLKTPSISGTIALTSQIGFVKHTWDEQISEYLKTSGTIFRGGKFIIEIEFIMKAGIADQIVDVFYGLNKGFVYFERFSDIIIEHGEGLAMNGTWTINKFFDNNTSYTSSESTVGQEEGEGYVYELSQDENGIYKQDAYKLASISDGIIFVWSNHPTYTSENTKRSLVLEGSIRGM